MKELWLIDLTVALSIGQMEWTNLLRFPVMKKIQQYIGEKLEVTAFFELADMNQNVHLTSIKDCERRIEEFKNPLKY